jgi:hypothetical protein
MVLTVGSTLLGFRFLGLKFFVTCYHSCFFISEREWNGNREVSFILVSLFKSLVVIRAFFFSTHQLCKHQNFTFALSKPLAYC